MARKKKEKLSFEKVQMGVESFYTLMNRFDAIEYKLRSLEFETNQFGQFYCAACGELGRELKHKPDCKTKILVNLCRDKFYQLAFEQKEGSLELKSMDNQERTQENGSVNEMNEEEAGE